LLSKEMAYVGLLFGLFVIPKVLQRWRVPAAITSLLLGAVAGPGLGWFHHDQTIGLLSTSVSCPCSSSPASMSRWSTCGGRRV